MIEEKPGYQQVASGMIMKMLGFIVSFDKQKDFSGKRVEKIIQNACFSIREHVESEINFQEFAEKNNIGYSYFRKMFKKYTGVPPVQYHLDLKVLRAKEMLLYTDKSIKEISYETHPNQCETGQRILDEYREEIVDGTHQFWTANPDSNLGLYIIAEPEYARMFRLRVPTSGPDAPRLEVFYNLPPEDRFW